MRPWLFLPALLLAGCLVRQPAPALRTDEPDRLLRAGLGELLDNHPPASLEKLSAAFPKSEQAALAKQLLRSSLRQPSATVPGGRKISSEQELKELREENRKLRSDLEKLRRLLIDSERRAR